MQQLWFFFLLCFISSACSCFLVHDVNYWFYAGIMSVWTKSFNFFGIAFQSQVLTFSMRTLRFLVAPLSSSFTFSRLFISVGKFWRSAPCCTRSPDCITINACSIGSSYFTLLVQDVRTEGLHRANFVLKIAHILHTKHKDFQKNTYDWLELFCFLPFIIKL